MLRRFYTSLLQWKDSPIRMPLLVRGARQTGKSYIIKTFGTQEFDQLITLNFELDPHLITCFDDLHPQKILEKITIFTNQTPTLGKTLLFLDEIQESPNAILALRYFKEQMPELHVIGAGSLLEFTLNHADFSMPVGRVAFLYLYPMTYYEFLQALNHDKLVEFLQQIQIGEEIPIAIHNRLIELLKLYLVIGGMPAAIEAYCKEKNLNHCQQIQAALLNTYKNDFGKYASSANQAHCRKIFEKAPYLVAKQFKYVDVDPNIQSRSLKEALHLLVQAGILHLVYFTQANGLPLNALINEKKFKLLFLDVGLVKYGSLLDAELLLQKDLLLVNSGQISEQFVGQELMAYQIPYESAQLYFWEKSTNLTSAEIDYVMNMGSAIIPIEVKAGKTGRLRSLFSFMEEKKSPLGIRISQDYFSLEGKILSLPLYMVGEVQRLAKMLLSQKGNNEKIIS